MVHRTGKPRLNGLEKHAALQCMVLKRAEHVAVHQLKQDNDLKHQSKSPTKWLQIKKIHPLEGPCRSTDLYPMEYDLKRAAHKRHPENITELLEVRSKIPPEYCAGLSSSYWKSSLKLWLPKEVWPVIKPLLFLPALWMLIGLTNKDMNYDYCLHDISFGKLYLCVIGT